MTDKLLKQRIQRIFTDRRFIFVGLLIILILMSFYFAMNYQKHLENPDTAVILKSYPLGQTVAVGGGVLNVQNGSFIISDMYHGVDVNYTIISDIKVSPGDQAEALGILETNNRINATKILVIPSFEYDFMLLRSAIVAIIFLFFFNHYWSFDTKRMEFRRRR
jgi:putative flippase GtrA